MAVFQGFCPNFLTFGSATPYPGFNMDTNNVKIDKIVEDLEKKYTGDANHDLAVVQEYCRTLPPCEESAKLVAALGKYASEKFPDAEAFKIGKIVEEAIQELEKEFNGDPDHDVKVVQDYCQALPKSEENFKVAMALGQYAAIKYPEAEEVKKSKAEFEKMNEDAKKVRKRIEDVQEMIKAGELDKAIAELRALLDENKFPEDDEKRFVSFSHPFEEILFQAVIKETRPIMRISNLTEMLSLQLGSLLAETGKFDEACEAIERAIFYNPVSPAANLELANIYVLQKKYEDAFEQLQKAYPILYSRQFLTVYFYLLSIVVENVDKNYPLAVVYAHLSLISAENSPAQQLIDRLVKEHGVDPERPSLETIKKLTDDAALPAGPNPEIYELAVGAARQFKASHPDIAKQFFAIAYELSGEESLLKEIR